MNQGRQLEYRTARVLSQLDPVWFTTMSDLLLPNEYNGKTTQIDHVVLSPFGLFVIECKDYNGMLRGYDTQTYWHYTNADSGFHYKVYSATAQNYTHIKVLKQILSDHELLRVESLIVFSDQTDFRHLHCRKSIPLHVSGLLDFFAQQNSMYYLLGAIDDMVALLEAAKIRGFRANQSHLENVKNTISNITFGGDNHAKRNRL